MFNKNAPLAILVACTACDYHNNIIIIPIIDILHVHVALYVIYMY